MFNKFTLNVASAYAPTFKLYHKMSFRKTALQNHTSGTYCFVEMEKVSYPRLRSTIKWYLKDMGSSVKYHMRFDSHSNSIFLNLVIHTTLRKYNSKDRTIK